MSDPNKQARIEALLRKSLLGEELVNTQFHLYSARYSSSKRVSKPRILCANNVLLANSSKYFLDLLGSDINPTDSSLVDLVDDHDTPSHAPIDDYGYGSDSDLDDCNDPPEDRPTSKCDDEVSDDGSESIRSDMFVMSPEHPKEAELLPVTRDGSGSIASTETAVHETIGDQNSENKTAVRLRSLASRHVLVKDTAFQTWYTLLNYLYTNKFNFSSLRSAMHGHGGPPESVTCSLDEPRCSAKSMYRLACKVDLDYLRDEAFAYIRNHLNERNILQELSCSLVSTHPQLLEMELDVLYTHIGSSPVVAGFPALARRIANKELAHGADIVVGIHTRFLKATHSRVALLKPLERKMSQPDGGEAKAEDGSCQAAFKLPNIRPGTVPVPSLAPVPSSSAKAGPSPPMDQERKPEKTTSAFGASSAFGGWTTTPTHAGSSDEERKPDKLPSAFGTPAAFSSWSKTPPHAVNSDAERKPDKPTLSSIFGALPPANSHKDLFAKEPPTSSGQFKNSKADISENIGKSRNPRI